MYYEFPNGAKSEYPTSAEEAKRLGKGVYCTLDGCPDCGQEGYTGFYAANGKCLGCFRKDLCEFLNQWKAGEAGDMPFEFPGNQQKALEIGIEWWLNEEICLNGPHPKAHHITRNYCVACRGDKNYIGRKRAQDKGEETYQSFFPCSVCLNHLFYTDSAKCFHCNQKKVKPERQMMDEEPDRVISRAQAKKEGLKVYRTGDKCRHGHRSWRRTDNGNCLDCSKGVPPVGDRVMTPEEEIMEGSPNMILPRAMAVQMGLKIYRTGKACTNGHTAWRRVDSSACVACIAENKKRYRERNKGDE